MNTRLFVGNLDYSTTDDQLRDAFSEFGELVSTSVVLDRMSGQSRGFAFVEFQSPEDAQRAIDSMNGATINGRSISVNVARERADRGGGGGFGGGGGGGGYGGGGGGGGGRKNDRGRSKGRGGGGGGRGRW
jgi:RNA recognition motif-containing protein